MGREVGKSSGGGWCSFLVSCDGVYFLWRCRCCLCTGVVVTERQRRREFDAETPDCLSTMLKDLVGRP
jgi:hypothetical protein